MKKLNFRNLNYLKILIITLSLLFSNLLIAQNKSEVLTNKTIVSLCNSGLSSAIIIAKIKKTKSSFKTGSDDLIRLKEEKVPDDIVNEWQTGSIGFNIPNISANMASMKFYIWNSNNQIYYIDDLSIKLYTYSNNTK